ncbi:transposase, IS407 family [Bordetella holmesii CDC-H635-BH]|nr:transposase, IS407 family [Bordetella holmesii CDC-H809-BH]KAK91181.1 transposase, IS407 family [Bordetella holmesii CDC-H635-BH]KCV03586.1 transposase, IS407 family [Bordetella holmesii CDC-H719-BH]KCV07418.1 transposase, IS407 family [Bordetella holmesii CDC-H785-BH]KCV13906.1 integrase core domain protein [Bordetella holmesii CDC-H643-BH]
MTTLRMPGHRGRYVVAGTACCHGAATAGGDAWPAAIYYRGQRARVRRKSLGRLGAYQAGVKLSFIRPGKPVENAYIESFNGKFRDECLNEHWFLSLRQAKSLIENWRVEYNTDRPHSALGYLTPAQFVQAHQKEGLLPLGSMSVPY